MHVKCIYSMRMRGLFLFHMPFITIYLLSKELDIVFAKLTSDIHTIRYLHVTEVSMKLLAKTKLQFAR